MLQCDLFGENREPVRGTLARIRGRGELRQRAGMSEQLSQIRRLMDDSR